MEANLSATDSDGMMNWIITE